MANNAHAFKSGDHPGYEETAWKGIQQTIDVIVEKGIKVVINGGALNPKGLALKVDELVRPVFYSVLIRKSRCQKLKCGNRSARKAWT
jgi:hypothetical protein